jgi:hypothetical protein
MRQYLRERLMAPAQCGMGGPSYVGVGGAGGGGGAGSAASGMLIFASIAAMAAFNIDVPFAYTSPGQQAFVQSNGSEWTLRRGDATVPDGITIVAGTGSETVKWVRENTGGYLARDLLQALWTIDPQNSSGVASDENTGDATHPLLHVAEVYRRLGYTWEPCWNQVVTFNYLSGSPLDGSDPFLFLPNLKGTGARFILTAPLPATSFTGTLLAVTAKNKASNAGLSSTFTTTTGAMAAGLLLVNSTRGNSRAFVQRSLGGGAWAIDQPFLPPNPTTGSLGGGTVDTWANGDAISAYRLIGVDLVQMGGTNEEFNADGGFAYVLANVTVMSPSGVANQDQVTVLGTMFIATIDVAFQRTFVVNGMGNFGQSQNCSFQIVVPWQVLGPWVFGGGDAGGPSAPTQVEQWIADGAVFMEDIRITQPNAIFRNCRLTFIMLDAPGLHIFEGETDGQQVPAAIVYGSGTITQDEGSFRYPATFAVTTFPTSGGLQLNRKTTAYSRVTSGGVTTIHGGIALTAANLNAAAGAAGFGDYAEGGGACFVGTGAQP